MDTNLLGSSMNSVTYLDLWENHEAFVSFGLFSSNWSNITLTDNITGNITLRVSQ